jgi:hypothetical protein
LKKNVKRLKLNRETIHQLNGPGMRWVAGGYITDPGFGDCTNDTTTSVPPTSGCGPQITGTAGSCGCETSNGPYACICLPQ